MSPAHRRSDGEPCPDCGSTYTHKIGFMITRSGKKQKWQCTVCGRAFHEERGDVHE